MTKNKEETSHFGIWFLLLSLSFFLILNFYFDGNNQDRITRLEIEKEIERTQNTRQASIIKNVTFVFDLDKKVWNNYLELVEGQESREIYGCYVMEFFIESFENKLLCIDWMGSQDIMSIEGKNIWEEAPYLLEHEKCDYLFSYFDGAFYMENKSNIRIDFDCSLNSAEEIIKFTLVDEY